MLPPQRSSKARRGNRRSHDRLQPASVVVCPNCGNSKRPHGACPNCGYVRPGLSIRREEEE